MKNLFAFKKVKGLSPYRENCWKEIWHIHGVTIIEVPFCGLEEIGT